MKILCIDDNKEIVKLLNRILTVKGFDFLSTNNGKEGLNFIRKEDPDIVLLDISMPYFSGRDILNELKKEGPIGDYNIILFTASEITDSEVDALVKEGVKGCLRKPVLIEELLSSIKKLEK